jgi:catechol 2,3-dioxygenase-like lactoylglutathione lyase family enzyme
MAVRGLNHLTLAVTDLAVSVAFYRDVLGMNVAAQWATGAYLEAGTLWLCLSQDAGAAKATRADYTHIAFDVAEAEFAATAARISTQARIWKDNRSEGDSLYFLDPDGHKLEIHSGSLASRLARYREHPPTDYRRLAGCH